MVDVEVIETSSLGDRSYLASDGELAVVVDPQRDVDRVLELVGRLGVSVTHVVETHLHNDYVSGGLALAQLTGAVYATSSGDQVDFERTAVGDGDVLEASPRLRLRAIATPGHTFGHLSYVLEGPDGPEGVFTGGSLLYGTTGRPDLLGDEHTETLARAQHASAQTLAERLPEGTRVWPTHGFGSFCTSSAASQDRSTLGEQKHVNPVLTLGRDQFVARTVAGLGPYPAYYAHMGVINQSGPSGPDLRPPAAATPEDLAERLRRGDWVVDLRSRTAYVESHLVGTVSLGLDGPMSTYLGWMIEWGTPITLVGDSREQIAEAQRELARIGIDRISAAAVGTPTELVTDPHTELATLPRATFADLATAMNRPDDSRTAGDMVSEDQELPPPQVVLDVRLTSEWNSCHIQGAVHIPLPELPSRLDEVPDGAVWAHCGSGYRATAAASMLAGRGRTAVVVDDLFANTEDAGLPLRTA